MAPSEYKGGIDRYPKPVDFYRDPRVKTLFGKYGAKGMYLLDTIYCKIYREYGYYLPMIWETGREIAEEANCGFTAKNVFDFVRSCMASGLFVLMRARDNGRGMRATCLTVRTTDGDDGIVRNGCNATSCLTVRTTDGDDGIVRNGKRIRFTGNEVITSRDIQTSYLEACQRLSIIDIDTRYLLPEYSLKNEYPSDTLSKCAHFTENPEEKTHNTQEYAKPPDFMQVQARAAPGEAERQEKSESEKETVPPHTPSYKEKEKEKKENTLNAYGVEDVASTKVARRCSPSGECVFSNQNFSVFWEEYPRKINRKRAFIEFMNVGFTNETFAKMMQTLREQKKSETWLLNSGRYIPGAEKFLQDRAWESETVKQPESKAWSFELDDFMTAAIEKTYGKDFAKNESGK